MPAKRAARAPSPRRRSNDHDDEVKINANGTIDLWVAGFRHHLARPTVGQLREYAEQFDSLVELEQSAKEKATEEEVTYNSRERGVDKAIYDYWRIVVGELDSNGGTLPDEDDEMPTWFGQPTLMTETFRAWKTVPWEGGSSPTEKELAAQMNHMGDLKPILDVMPDLLKLVDQTKNGAGPSNGALPPLSAPS